MDENFLLGDVDPVPDHGQVELVMQVHVRALQQGREDLLVKLSFPEIKDSIAERKELR